MRKSRVSAKVLGAQDMVIDDVMIKAETSRGEPPVSGEVLVFEVRPKANRASRCSRCHKRCPGYDGGEAIRRWRTLDLGTTKAYPQAAASQGACREHGVVVANVPWVRPGARHT